MKLQSLCDKIQIAYLIREGIKERQIWDDGKVRLVRE